MPKSKASSPQPTPQTLDAIDWMGLPEGVREQVWGEALLPNRWALQAHQRLTVQIKDWHAQREYPVSADELLSRVDEEWQAEQRYAQKAPRSNAAWAKPLPHPDDEGEWNDWSGADEDDMPSFSPHRALPGSPARLNSVIELADRHQWLHDTVVKVWIKQRQEVESQLIDQAKRVWPVAAQQWHRQDEGWVRHWMAALEPLESSGAMVSRIMGLARTQEEQPQVQALVSHHPGVLDADAWWLAWANQPTKTPAQQAAHHAWTVWMLNQYPLRQYSTQAMQARTQWILSHATDAQLHPSWQGLAQRECADVKPSAASVEALLRALHQRAEVEQWNQAADQQCVKQQAIQQLVQSFERLGWSDWAWSGLGQMQSLRSTSNTPPDAMDVGALLMHLRKAMQGFRQAHDEKSFASGALLQSLHRAAEPTSAQCFAEACQALFNPPAPTASPRRARL